MKIKKNLMETGVPGGKPPKLAQKKESGTCEARKNKCAKGG